MIIKKLIYVRKSQFSKWLLSRIFKKRVGTAMQTMLQTLSANHMLPKNLIALELFGFIGTNATMDYAHLADYIEMWEIDPFFAKEAQKYIPKARVICGDSIKAISNGGLLRKDYNFIVIDPNVFMHNYVSFESFGIFGHALKYVAKDTVIFVNIFNNVEEYIKKYGANERIEDWIKARKEFFAIDNVVSARGIDYLKGFEKIIKAEKLDIVYSNFISRNEYVGFGVFVLKKC